MNTFPIKYLICRINLSEFKDRNAGLTADFAVLQHPPVLLALTTHRPRLALWMVVGAAPVEIVCWGALPARNLKSWIRKLVIQNEMKERLTLQLHCIQLGFRRHSPSHPA